MEENKLPSRIFTIISFHKPKEIVKLWQQENYKNRTKYIFQRNLKCHHHGKNERNAEQKFKLYEESIKDYLEATSEHLTKRINELNGKSNDLQDSIEHSDEVNL